MFKVVNLNSSVVGEEKLSNVLLVRNTHFAKSSSLQSKAVKKNTDTSIGY